jgi:DNA repair exonuclease SbcCD ATPase subunit
VRFVSFKSIKIKNFLSVGKIPVEINFQPGINVITGVNYDKEDSKNGVGKSTIVEALHFALFGTTIRDLPKDLIVNSITKQKCEVELIFAVTTSSSLHTYCIKRTLQPTKCSITKDGVDVTRSTLIKTNEYIQTTLNTTSKVFQNSVIMTVNNTIPFMAQSKIDKRKFIESVLNLQVFSDMLSRVREEHSNIKREHEIKFLKKETTEKHYCFNKQQLDLFETNKQNKIKELQNKLNEDTNTVTALQNQIVTIPDSIEGIFIEKEKTHDIKKSEIDEMYNNLLNLKAENQAEIKLYEKQKNEIDLQKAICNECRRPFTDDDKKHKQNLLQGLDIKINFLVQKISNTQQQLNKLVDAKNILQDSFKTLQNKRQEINNIINQNINCKNKIQYINDNISSVKTQIHNIQQEVNTDLENTVKATEQEIIQLQLELDGLSIELDVLECVKFVVSEEGVKSYIVKKILKLLNNRLSYYLNLLETNCTCTFNEFFDEGIVDELGEQKSYFNFSGGERKRIDLACLFAFLDIRRLQGDINFSTIFYDELLDSSLDDKGVNLVIKTLRERKEKYNESCYIITHRGSAILNDVDNIINLEKRSGLTYLLK